MVSNQLILFIFKTNILQFFHNFIAIIAFLIIQTATSLIQTSNKNIVLVFYKFNFNPALFSLNLCKYVLVGCRKKHITFKIR